MQIGIDMSKNDTLGQFRAELVERLKAMKQFPSREGSRLSDDSAPGKTILLRDFAIVILRNGRLKNNVLSCLTDCYR